MSGFAKELRQRLAMHSDQWRAEGLASREVLVKTAESLIQWRERNGLTGIWPEAPRMFTTTLDDGIGQGLEIIQLFARAMGMTVTCLGLVQKPQAIVDACRLHRPEFLGMTVLQMDSEEDLAFIGRRLPPETRLIAGGPAFKYDPQMAARCGVHHVAANVAIFIDLLLKEPENIINPSIRSTL